MSVNHYTGCLRIERADGQVLTMTELDRDIVYNAETYVAAASFTSSVLEGKADLSVTNAEFEFPITITGLSRADLTSGRFDAADARIFVFDWLNNTKVRDLGVGTLGEVSMSGNMGTVEFRSITQQLQQPIGKSFLTECDARLGDLRCGVSLASFTYSGSITSVTSNSVFVDTALIGTQSDDYYNYGLVTFTSGANNGLSKEVKDYDDATGAITTFVPFPYDIAASDTFTVYAGCDKRQTTCISTFNNIVNFRGFPFIVGQDQAMRYGGQ